MKRRTFLHTPLALTALSACGSLPIKERVQLKAVLHDPIAGRAHYVDGQGRRNPTLHWQRGERVQVQFHNHLPQPTSLHWHGLPVNSQNDGAGWLEVLPGEQQSLEFVVNLPAGLYWYHPHPHGLTAEQTYAGLAGLIVVHEPDESSYIGATILVASVSDVRIDTANQQILPYQASSEECLNGYLGNQILINGIRPQEIVCNTILRLRLCNTSNARIYLLSMQVDEEKVPMRVLGTDIGQVNSVWSAQDSVFFAPGERLDLMIDFSKYVGRKWQLKSLPFDAREQHLSEKTQFNLSTWHQERHQRWPSLAAGQRCSKEQLQQARLPQGTALSLIQGQVERQAAIVVKTHSVLAKIPNTLDYPIRRIKLGFDNGRWRIDESNYADNPKQYTIKRGSREVWEISATPVGMPHPMHWHHFGVRVLSRKGTYGPARQLPRDEEGRMASDMGMKDTVLIWPGETVRVLIDFHLPDTDEYKGPQKFMWHCHNLEHEDGMMMAALIIE